MNDLIERLLGGAPTHTDGGTDWQALNDLHKEAAARIAELEAEVARLRVDGERYRAIRAKVRGERVMGGDRIPSNVQIFVFPHFEPVGNIMQGSVAQHLDEAIDAAKESA